MTKREQMYEIKQAARGSFVGARGRVVYDLEAGTVTEKGVDAEVLARLVSAGVAAKAAAPARNEESA